jgi:thymidylate kinase
MIIALDGSDGSGKSTAATLLRDYLTIDRQYQDESKKPCVYQVNHPGSTEVGKELRRIVKDPKFKPTATVARLCFAADTVQFESEYAELSEAGAIVICDRFSRATDLVYGAADELSLDFISGLQNYIGLSLKADFYFVFQCSAETAIARKEARTNPAKITALGSVPSDRCRIEEKGREHAGRIATAFNSLHDFDMGSGRAGMTTSPLQCLVEARVRRIRCLDAENSTVASTLKSIIAEINPFLPAAK